MNSIVYNEDCITGMKRYEDNHFDLAVVDPDYGLNDKLSQGGTWAAKYKKGDGELGGKPTKEYFDELFRISKNQIIWGGNYFIENLYSTRCFIIWDKIVHLPTMADFEMAWTSFDKNSKVLKVMRTNMQTNEDRIHICQKPVKLYDKIFQNYASEGMKILDTHLGSGSSRISAHKNKLDFTGFEIDKDYFEAAEKRFNFHKQQQTLF